MIPRIIHYCWFGSQAQPANITRCLDSWKRVLPGYEIIRWNEENADMHYCSYLEEAYRSKKYAFVSDVVRGLALYSHGGIYLDADVEVVKPFDPFLAHRSFWGFEAGCYVATSTIGAAAKNEIIKEYLDYYRGRHFILPDGSFDTTTNVSHLTRLMEHKGLVLNDTKQELGDGNVVYPQIVFSPYDSRTGAISRNAATVAIHHYRNTWDMSAWFLVKRNLKNVTAKLIGAKLSEHLWLGNKG